MVESQVSINAGPTVCRKPTPADAADIHALVEECKPLDVNSTYAYLLLCSHFASTCIVAEDGRGLAGFISGYCKPDDPWLRSGSPRFSPAN
jgi:L-2,4-diaminobutyric acid acetyltransferase